MRLRNEKGVRSRSEIQMKDWMGDPDGRSRWEIQMGDPDGRSRWKIQVGNLDRRSKWELSRSKIQMRLACEPGKISRAPNIRIRSSRC